MKHASLVDTILSSPDEWVSLGVGILAAAIIIYGTDTKWMALAAIAVFALAIVPLLPVPVGQEWHYWGAAMILAALLYELGP